MTLRPKRKSKTNDGLAANAPVPEANGDPADNRDLDTTNLLGESNATKRSKQAQRFPGKQARMLAILLAFFCLLSSAFWSKKLPSRTIFFLSLSDLADCSSNQLGN